MHYRHNFLTKVIFRLEFESVQALSGTSKPKFSDAIQALYPIAAGKPTATISVNVGPGGSGIQQQVTGMLWEHRKQPDGTQIVQLTPEFLHVEYGKGDFDDFAVLCRN